MYKNKLLKYEFKFKKQLGSAAPVPNPIQSMFARISSSRQPYNQIGAFAGGALPHTILSSCHGTLLSMFTTWQVLPLRVTCRDSVVAVAARRWEDEITKIINTAR